MPYVVWSHKHNQWWGPDHCGYTRDLSKAGRYTQAEAGQIVVDMIPPGTNVAMDERVALNRGPEAAFGYRERGLE